MLIIIEMESVVKNSDRFHFCYYTLTLSKSMNPIPGPIESCRIRPSDEIQSESGFRNHWWIRRSNHNYFSFDYYSSSQYYGIQFYSTIGSDCRIRLDSNTRDPSVILQTRFDEFHWIPMELSSVHYRIR